MSWSSHNFRHYEEVFIENAFILMSTLRNGFVHVIGDFLRHQLQFTQLKVVHFELFTLRSFVVYLRKEKSVGVFIIVI